MNLYIEKSRHADLRGAKMCELNETDTRRDLHEVPIETPIH